MEIDTSVIEKNGKVMLLAYDQGFEHGPVDFNERNVDPEFVVKLSESGYFTGVIFQEGVAAKYYDKKEHKLPLVIKLNGKTSYQKGRDPLSLQLCTVEKAIELGAKGVGYTIYVGSEHEEKMMVEFSRIEDEAHKAGLTVIAWMYPRGKKVEGKENDKETVAYAARLGMELNADFVKVPYTGDKESFEWVVKSAGKTGVLAQGGGKKGWEELEKEVKEIMSSGAKGLAIGRNVWQADNYLEIAEKLSKLVY
jgi:fructose-bisphosphate aldolase, class I